jgi:hypothetical protein
MKTIRTYDDLLAEKESLEAQLAVQKAFIKQDIKTLQAELKPATQVVSLLGKMTTKDTSNPAVAFGVDIAGDFLIKNTLLRRAGWLSRLLVPFFMKNLSTHLLNGNKKPAVNLNFFSRLASKLKPN